MMSCPATDAHFHTVVVGERAITFNHALGVVSSIPSVQNGQAYTYALSKKGDLEHVPFHYQVLLHRRACDKRLDPCPVFPKMLRRIRVDNRDDWSLVALATILRLVVMVDCKQVIVAQRC
jgi:hypothetical protein